MRSSSSFLPLRHGVPHRPQQQQRSNPLSQIHLYLLSRLNGLLVPHHPQQQQRSNPNPISQLHSFFLVAAVTCSVAYLSAYSLRSSAFTNFAPQPRPGGLPEESGGFKNPESSPLVRQSRLPPESDSVTPSVSSLVSIPTLSSAASASVPLSSEESSGTSEVHRSGDPVSDRTVGGSVGPRQPSDESGVNRAGVALKARQTDSVRPDISASVQLQEIVSPRLLNSSPADSPSKPETGPDSDPSLPNQTPDKDQPDRQVRDDQRPSDDTCSPPIGVKLPPSPSTSPEPVTVAPEWIPLPKRYLMVSCTNGGSTNRLLCLQTTILAAILLNRTLLIPEVPLCIPRSLGRPVVYSETLDIGYLSRCFGDEPKPEQPGPEAGSEAGSKGGSAEHVLAPRRVMTTSELLKLRGGGGGAELVVDKFLCGQVQYSCTLVDGSCGDVPTEIKLSKKEVVGEESSNIYDLAPKIAAATANVPVLALGDLYFAFFKLGDPGSEFFWPSRFFNTQCGLLFLPPQPVLEQAAGFIQEYIGRNYASLHLRRTDFLGHSHWLSDVQYWSLQAVAECTAAKMLQVNVTNLFVSSDASDEEVGVFTDLLMSQASLARARGEPWSVVVVRLPKEPVQEPAQRAMVDKLVAAHAVVTMFTHRSTFSHHIGYLREGLGLASCHDGHICQGRPREAVGIEWQH
ncbi:hypothetical protein CLOM_g9204 [Closterium sp. NIES-68]|nr:hypothetical protein CLOM_g9204 [Closterium sp. NIES-68]GJP61434.1 hypothetical protein CLOP_g18598 [Closterium sp. NIES-67]